MDHVVADLDCMLRGLSFDSFAASIERGRACVFIAPVMYLAKATGLFGF